MARQVYEGTVVDDAFCLAFADDGRLHPVVKHVPWSAAESLKGRDMATQNSRQVLMHDEAGPDQTAVPQHHREQPDDPWRHRFIGEDDMELGEIDLGLLTRRRIEPDFKALTCSGA